MSTTEINTHYGTNIKWIVYRNGYNAWVGTLSPTTDISSLTFTAYFRTPSGSSNKLTLTQGSGITNGGAAGTITIELTEAQLATLQRDRYFIVIEYTVDSKAYPLAQGYIEISDETNPGTTSTTATIPVSIEGTSVSMSVTMVSPANQVTTNRQTASYTLALSDAGKLVEMNVASANNLTVPPNSSVAFPLGTQILLAQYGAGQTTVVAGSGVTIRSAGSALKLTEQYSAASLTKIATNEWYLFGDITA